MTNSESPFWYALTVQPNHEMTAARGLGNRGFEAYVPVYKSRRQWTDRTKEINTVLFPGYVFCRFGFAERLHVLQSPGVRTVVGSARQPAPVSDEEIASVRALVSSGRPVSPWPYLQAGQRVVIDRGPLENVRGVIVRVKNTWRVVVRVEALGAAVAVEVDSECLSPEWRAPAGTVSWSERGARIAS